jgi:hypothetical protein
LIETACIGNETQGTITPKTMNISDMETEDLLCTFPNGTFRVKGNSKFTEYDIDIYAKFNFMTLSYLKAYFIDKERQRALRRDNIDPLDEYGITDKNPLAVYTNGPIQIGMETSSPLVGLYSDGSDNPDFRLGMTITNAWRGRVLNITRFEIQVPDTMEIDKDSCDKAVISGDPSISILAKEYSSGFNTFVIDPALITSIRSFDDFETINCRVNIKDPVGTLGETPISTKYFRVLIDYMYELEETQEITIRNPNATWSS